MTIRVWLKDEIDTEAGPRMEYGFGSDEEQAGRVAVDPASGDVELLELNDDMPPPGARYYLASVVPRFHQYHDDGRFPDSDAWQG